MANLYKITMKKVTCMYIYRVKHDIYNNSRPGAKVLYVRAHFPGKYSYRRKMLQQDGN